ncbi:MAG: hypothetical protein PWQ22_1013 [Archaeoglobaceae archaeon]|nr:hypothetical protein [Archaeoglobaceae archaeon]
MRVLGIDPGTKSMDLCLLENGELAGEASVETKDVAVNPDLLLENVREMGQIDVVVVPSGYGVEVMELERIPEELLEDWYYTFVLATTKEEIEEGVANGIVGANIYLAMTQFVKKLYEFNAKKILIPGVINLPTIPLHRKLNKIDMGTADKLAVTVLGIHEMAEEHRIDYNKVNYIHVELGFGYNSVIGIRGGRIVDGMGGSLFPGPSFLTAGALDLEVAQAVGRFEKKDVFTTGCASTANTSTPEELVERSENDWKCRLCFDAMIEGICKAVYQISYIVEDPSVVMLSGRVSRIPKIKKELEKELQNFGEARVMRGLPGAKTVKETAQGYAVIGDGLSGGRFSNLIRHVGIDEAKGSALDYIAIPSFRESRLGKNFARLRKVGFKEDLFFLKMDPNKDRQ